MKDAKVVGDGTRAGRSPVPGNAHPPAAAAHGVEGQDDERREMLLQITHDMAGPLTPIAIQLFVLRKHEQALPHLARQALPILSRNVAQLQRLVDSLREAAQLEAPEPARAPADGGENL